MSRLRLTAGVRYWTEHRDPRCEGWDPEACRCGLADFVAKVQEIEEETSPNRWCQGKRVAGDGPERNRRRDE